MIYLDYAATAPVPEAVAKTVYDVLTESYGNPSSQYAIGRNARSSLQDCRNTIASALGCPADQLYFTSCGSEGDNWAIRAALWQNRRVGKHILTTAVEHSAVLETMKALEQQGYEVTYLRPDSAGHISAERVRDALRDDTALVSMMMVNNETGNRYPVSEVAGLLRERQSPALFHCDAVQAFLEVPFRAASLGPDLLVVSGHKIGAPKGIGALYAGPRVRLQPLIYGGGQESGLRGGTEATAQIAGFAKAVALRKEKEEELRTKLQKLHDYAKEQLSALPSLVFLGTSQVPHILAFSLPGYPSQNVVTDLSDQGICLSAGSACHQGKPSHVTAALRLNKKTAAGALRMSFGPETTKEEIDTCVEALKKHCSTRFPML